MNEWVRLKINIGFGQTVFVCDAIIVPPIEQNAFFEESVIGSVLNGLAQAASAGI